MKITPITGNRDFQRIYRRGKSCVSPGLVTYVLKNKNNNLRIGITTSKKVGKAVKRNRSRRLIRAAFSNLNVDRNQSFDVIFVARTKTCYLKSYEVERYMREHLTTLGLLRSS
jgi:ribonuclease P protein component